MANDDLVKISATKAVDVCKLMEITLDTENLLKKELTPGQFIDVLVEKKNYSQAIQFLSYALPKREAVWWGTLCIRKIQDDSNSKVQLDALESAEHWVKNPSEENRQACGLAAEHADYSNPPGLIAMASYWSSGSMTPPDYPPVDMPPDLTPKMVSAALTLATIQSEPEKASDKFKFFLEQGLNIARGEINL